MIVRKQLSTLCIMAMAVAVVTLMSAAPVLGARAAVGVAQQAGEGGLAAEAQQPGEQALLRYRGQTPGDVGAVHPRRQLEAALDDP